MQVSRWLSNISFHGLLFLQPWLLVRSFPSFCAQPSEVSALFNCNLSRHPFLGQVVNLDLLLCTGLDSENADLFLGHLCLYFTRGPMNDGRIEQSYERCFGS